MMMNEYKGIYHDYKKEKRFYEGGAHFKYSALVKVLEELKLEQSRLERNNLKTIMKSTIRHSSQKILPKIGSNSNIKTELKKEVNKSELRAESLDEKNKTRKFQKNLSNPNLIIKKTIKDFNKISFPRILNLKVSQVKLGDFEKNKSSRYHSKPKISSVGKTNHFIDTTHKISQEDIIPKKTQIKNVRRFEGKFRKFSNPKNNKK